MNARARTGLAYRSSYESGKINDPSEITLEKPSNGINLNYMTPRLIN